MLRCLFLAFAGFMTLYAISPAPAQEAPARQRVLVLTDIENEPDDAQSLIRFLTYANQWDIEGLIATTSIHLPDHVAPDRIRQIIATYGTVRNNLLQHEPGYPTAEQLLAVVSQGPPVYGMKAVGQALSPGAQQLIAAVDKADDRPLWVLVWGGANTLAQALAEVKQTRSPAELDRFVAKLRAYTISDQDDAGPWLRQSFPNLFYIASPGMHAGGGYHMSTWVGISGDRFLGRFAGGDFSLVSLEWLEKNVMAKGPLGAIYPKPLYIMEGDTPSFLYLINNGLGDAEHPDWGSWGGRYEFYTPRLRKWFLVPEERPFWSDAEDEVLGADGQWHTSNQATIWRWREAYQNDFAARMDWTIKPYDQANHPPKPALRHPARLTARVGDRISLDASGSSDPDGNSLSYQWFIYGEAGRFTTATDRTGSLGSIENADKPQAVLVVPSQRVVRTGDLHVILAVTDNGSPRLTRYQRVIIEVMP
jgi:hypothetical protein